MVTPPHAAHSQRGAAAMVTSVLLMLIASLVLFYLNRSLIFEQKTSANQVRSTVAHEIAEAGLEWVTGMMNAPFDINTNCNPLSTTNLSFRKKYLQTYWNRARPDPANASESGFYDFYDSTTAIVPVRKTYPGCKINGTALTCSCPDLNASTTPLNYTTGETQESAAVYPAVGTVALPAFSVAFAPVRAAFPPADHPNQHDPEAVLVTVTGCTATTGDCRPGTATGAGGPDGVATVSAIIKLRPLLRAGPAAALTCGGSCAPGGSYNIYNTDLSTNGVTINAGGTVTLGSGVTTASIPGLPPANALVTGDSSLASLASSDPTCGNSAMFKAYFGSTIEEYSESTNVKSIPNCTNASSCGASVVAAYNDGWRNFYFPDGVSLNNSSGLPGGALGEADRPVTLVTPAAFNINGNISVYGVVFSNDANVNDLGTGTANIYGGIVACRNQQSNGNGTIAYDAKVMRGIRRDSAGAVRVPGSWTDSCKLNGAHPPARTCS
ncbi:MAG: pilus assembly PilX family protein [Roseateles sp.]|uniref:pilus assembly PilX family protein n=1 Tax=Roseateles sp. TaxID=1971397 RepID=UPI004035790F